MFVAKLRQDLETIRRCQSGNLSDQGARGTPRCLRTAEAVMASAPGTAHPSRANVQSHSSKKQVAEWPPCRADTAAPGVQEGDNRAMHLEDLEANRIAHLLALGQQLSPTPKALKRKYSDLGSKRGGRGGKQGGRGKRQSPPCAGQLMPSDIRPSSSSSERLLKRLRGGNQGDATSRSHKDPSPPRGFAAPSRRTSCAYQLRPPSGIQPRYDFPSDGEAEA